jgi:hypothetical protein
MKKSIIPEEFVIPEILRTEHILLRCLTVDDVIKDYDAVITSIEHLQKTKPFGLKSNWPTKDLTIEQDLIDLEWHQKEFQNRSSFAYTVMSLKEESCLGCLYIYPSEKEEFDCEVTMWVRESEVEKGLDRHLFETVEKWIHDVWPFKRPAYPGREINWKDWGDTP